MMDSNNFPNGVARQSEDALAEPNGSTISFQSGATRFPGAGSRRHSN